MSRVTVYCNKAAACSRPRLTNDGKLKCSLSLCVRSTSLLRSTWENSCSVTTALFVASCRTLSCSRHACCLHTVQAILLDTFFIRLCCLHGSVQSDVRRQGDGFYNQQGQTLSLPLRYPWSSKYAPFFVVSSFYESNCLF